MLLLQLARFSSLLSRNLTLGALFLGAPFFIYPGKVAEPQLYQALLFQCLAIILAITGGQSHKKITIISLVAAFFIVTTSEIFHISAFYQAQNILSGVLFLYAIKPSDYPLIKKLLGISCLMSCLFVMVQLLGIDPYSQFMSFFGYQSVGLNPHPASGSLGNKIHSALFVIATMFFISPKLWIIPLVTMLFMDSQLAMASAFIGACSFFSYKRKEFEPLIISAISICGIGAFSLFGSGMIFTGRLETWTAFLKWFGIKPLGAGVGYIAIHFKNVHNYAGQIFSNLHSELFEVYAIAGIVGLGLFVMVARDILNPGKPELNACLITLLFSCLGNFSFHIAPLFIVFGACYAIHIKKEPSWHNQQ